MKTLGTDKDRQGLVSDMLDLKCCFHSPLNKLIHKAVLGRETEAWGGHPDSEEAVLGCDCVR